ncbi:unnamed protein product, partial [Closterium sp. NIES-54]
WEGRCCTTTRTTTTARAASTTSTPTSTSPSTSAFAAALLCYRGSGGGVAKDFCLGGDNPLGNLSGSVMFGEELHVGQLVGIEGRSEAFKEVAADDGVRVGNTKCCKAASKVKDAASKGGCAGSGIH